MAWSWKISLYPCGSSPGLCLSFADVDQADNVNTDSHLHDLTNVTTSAALEVMVDCSVSVPLKSAAVASHSSECGSYVVFEVSAFDAGVTNMEVKASVSLKSRAWNVQSVEVSASDEIANCPDRRLAETTHS